MHSEREAYDHAVDAREDRLDAARVGAGTLGANVTGADRVAIEKIAGNTYKSERQSYAFTHVDFVSVPADDWSIVLRVASEAAAHARRLDPIPQPGGDAPPASASGASSVIAISGAIGSGKAALAEKLAEATGAQVASFGAEVRRRVTELGGDATNRTELQRIGNAMVLTDLKGFVERTLAQAGPNLIVSGLRHWEVLDELRRQLAPRRVVLVHVEASRETRERSLLKTPGADHRQIGVWNNDICEAQISRVLPQYAALKVDGDLPVYLQVAQIKTAGLIDPPAPAQSAGAAADGEDDEAFMARMEVLFSPCGDVVYHVAPQDAFRLLALARRVAQPHNPAAPSPDQAEAFARGEVAEAVLAEREAGALHLERRAAQCAENAGLVADDVVRDRWLFRAQVIRGEANALRRPAPVLNRARPAGQGEGEPVAWQYRVPPSIRWHEVSLREHNDIMQAGSYPEWEWRPLYAAPPSAAAPPSPASRATSAPAQDAEPAGVTDDMVEAALAAPLSYGQTVEDWVGGQDRKGMPLNQHGQRRSVMRAALEAAACARRTPDAGQEV